MKRKLSLVRNLPDSDIELEPRLQGAEVKLEEDIPESRLGPSVSVLASDDTLTGRAGPSGGGSSGGYGSFRPFDHAKIEADSERIHEIREALETQNETERSDPKTSK